MQPLPAQALALADGNSTDPPIVDQAGAPVHAKGSSPAASSLPVADPNGVGLSPERLPRVGAFIEPLVSEHEIAGVVTAVARRGKLARLEAQGFADLDCGRPMRMDDIFWFSSIMSLLPHRPCSELARILTHGVPFRAHEIDQRDELPRERRLAALPRAEKRDRPASSQRGAYEVAVDGPVDQGAILTMKIPPLMRECHGGEVLSVAPPAHVS